MDSWVTRLVREALRPPKVVSSREAFRSVSALKILASLLILSISWFSRLSLSTASVRAASRSRSLFASAFAASSACRLFCVILSDAAASASAMRSLRALSSMLACLAGVQVDARSVGDGALH